MTSVKPWIKNRTFHFSPEYRCVTMPPLEILYEDNHLLVVDKPAGLPTIGAPAGTATLLERAKEYIKGRFSKPGNVYLGVMSRLDAPVTGVVLFGGLRSRRRG